MNDTNRLHVNPGNVSSIMKDSTDSYKQPVQFFPSSMSADKIKRKRIVVTIQQKLEAIKRIDGGATLSEIARQYGVSANTVGDWKRGRKIIEEFASQKVSVVERKSMKLAVYLNTDQAVHTWFQQQQSLGVYVSGPMVMAKAKELSKLFPEENKFVASEGWLAKWKLRYGIPFSGEKPSAKHVSPVTLCTTELKDEMKDLDWIKKESDIKTEETDSPNEDVEENEEIEDKDAEDELVSSVAGYEAIQTALKFVEQQPSATPADINILIKWKDYAAQQLTKGFCPPPSEKL